MIIRPLVATDLDSVRQIINATELFPSDMLDSMVADYLSKTGEDFWSVCEADTKAIGVAYTQPERMTDGTWNMLALAVAPEMQKQGAGRALIDHTRNHLKSRGARLMLIETADIAEFADQRDFYARCGLTQVAHIQDYYEENVGKVTFAQQLT